MPMSRLFAPLLVLTLSGLLAACADLDTQPAAAPAQVAWSAPAPATAAMLQASAPAPAAPAASEADTAREPIIIRGNDRLVAPPSVPFKGPAKGASTALKFESAPVAEVVKVVLGDLLKVDYVVHPPLGGNITLTTRQAVSPDRALLLLESALQASGVVMARDAHGTYHVGSPEALKGIVSVPVLAEPGKPLPPGYGTVIIPLEYLGAGEMANILRPMVAADAIVRVDSLRNIIIMRGTRAEAEGWLDLVKTFDVNLLRGMSVGVFPLKYTSAADVEAALRLLSSGTAAGASAAGGATGQAPAAAVPARPGGNRAAPAAGAAAPAAMQGLGESSAIFGALRIVPIERINAVLVISPRAAYLDEARYWIERFDQPNLNSTEPQLFVYKVQNGSASHLAELLNGIYGGGPQGGATGGATGVAPGLTNNVNTSFASQFSGRNQSSQVRGYGNTGLGGSLGGSGFGLGGASSLGAGNRGNAQQAQGPGVVTTQLASGVRVMADQINNTLLIHASAAEYERIAATLRRLDIQRAQVLIEASIVEVTLGDGLQYGLQWTFNGGTAGRTGIGVLGNPATAATPGANSSSFTYSLINGANVNAVLTALANKSLVKVMSSPSLMVLDNHTAAIQVGSQQPVNTGTTFTGGTNNYATTNIQYKDTGVMLGVTPSVSAGDLVTLDIDQIVTDIGPDSTSAATAGYPTFMQRQINSKVAVRSGETLVLGGLIKDSASSSKSGVPILSAIPVLGALFGQHRNTAERTELLVILTPRVLRSDEDARAVSRELRDRMQGLLHSGAVPAAAPAAARP
ncbi:MAG: type II secretion system secretin GspD [Burkholderiaceae bacterium]